MEKFATPTQTTCEDVAALLGVPLATTVKAYAVVGEQGFVLALVRGDHMVNEIKLQKVEGLGEYRLATEAEIVAALGCVPGFIGPVRPVQKITVVADRAVAVLADFVCGANAAGFHLKGVNFGRECAEPDVIADIRSVVEGDPSPDGAGHLHIARGIEVGHVFQLGQKYAEAMKATVLDANGKSAVMYMGCYGIGVSRIVAAAIEQNHDAAGIIWPAPMAPWQVAVCMINPKNDPKVAEVAESLYRDLEAEGIEVVLDDRGLRPGVMFADIELLGIPHRVVVSERGIAAGTFEYRARRAAEAEALTREQVLERLGV
jgi:prolyl-tRNA synthetase